jgi:hypothetical protein
MFFYPISFLLIQSGIISSMPARCSSLSLFAMSSRSYWNSSADNGFTVGPVGSTIVPAKTSPESPTLKSFKRPFAPVSNSIPFFVP